STGEQVSVSLFCLAAQGLGYKARSLLGYQAGIQTSRLHTKARIKDIDATRLRQELAQGQIVAVAGFQGLDRFGDITTLGRGGSDTTAVALAAALGAEVCEIYTDVPGVFTTDPGVCPEARKMDYISYDEMLEMASLGAKVLDIRSVALAKQFQVPIHVRSTFEDTEGTMVVNEEKIAEKLMVSGVAYNKNEARITVRGLPDQPGVAAKLFTPVAEAGIVVDMIIQNTSADGLTDMTFTVPKVDFTQAMNLVTELATGLGAADVLGQTDVAKVSVIGVGMHTHAGVATRMFNALAQENINIDLISTSEIKVSCLINEKYTELAVRTLHKAFELDRDAPPREETL
ncbi:MAG: aspartate kinase, partial [Proteobacteria bacterium]|nr:aspartate kinase [Pseudomonadota bacterium]